MNTLELSDELKLFVQSMYESEEYQQSPLRARMEIITMFMVLGLSSHVVGDKPQLVNVERIISKKEPLTRDDLEFFIEQIAELIRKMVY